MSAFKLSADDLKKMMELAQFEVPDDEYVIVGLRGCLPLFYEDISEKSSHMVELQQVDNRFMRCTLALWRPQDGVFSLYPGSTVPSTVGIRKQKNAGSRERIANQLVTCFLSKAESDGFMMDRRYRQRVHGGSVPHWALGNDNKQPVQRSFDDLDYDGGDDLLDQTVNDNIHCAGNPDPNEPGVGSYGCQTVAGTARHGARSNTHTTDITSGPWQTFKDRIYAAGQRYFSYALFHGYEARKTALAGDTRRPTVRFGSTGALVKKVQSALNDKGYPAGRVDGLAGFGTMKQVFAFQRDQFSEAGADLIVGVGTAARLGLDDWPQAGADIADIQTDVVNDVLVAADHLGAASKRENVPEQLTGTHAVLDTDHKPLNGWNVLQDRDGNGNKVWFLEADGLPQRFKIGREQSYDGHSKLDCTGISRHHQHAPEVPFRPEDWEAEFGLWPFVLDGLIHSESDRNFAVCNGYDVAGFTAFCSQLAAHTGDDLLLALENVVRNIPDEAAQFFPELQLVDDRLHYAYDGQLIDLYEKVDPYDGEYSQDYYFGHLMSFLNPSRKKVDMAEVHAAARFSAWAYTSQNFRREQIVASIDNAMSSIVLLHQKMRKSALIRGKYPKGMDGMRADWLAAVLHIPHISPNRALDAAKLLLKDDPLEAAIAYQIPGHEGRSDKIRASIKEYGETLSAARFDLDNRTFS